MPHASALLPPGTALSRAGVISFHPVDDGPQPGSSRTKYKVTDPAEPVSDPPGESASLPLSQMGHGEPSMPVSHEREIRGLEETMPANAAHETHIRSATIVPSFTPDEDLELLFDPSLIPQSMRDSLGPGLHVRFPRRTSLTAGTPSCVDGSDEISLRSSFGPYRRSSDRPFGLLVNVRADEVVWRDLPHSRNHRQADRPDGRARCCHCREEVHPRRCFCSAYRRYRRQFHLSRWRSWEEASDWSERSICSSRVLSR